jgi:hypothetical protein
LTLILDFLAACGWLRRVSAAASLDEAAFIGGDDRLDAVSDA